MVAEMQAALDLELPLFQVMDQIHLTNTMTARFLTVWAFRELSNLVELIEHKVERGKLRDEELFMFTDNSMAEAAYHNGSSSNKRLSELVLHLRCLKMMAGLNIYVIWKADDWAWYGRAN
jgi:hypothetical protein